MNITATVPASSAINAQLKPVVQITFDELVDPISVDNSSITVATKKTNMINFGAELSSTIDLFTSNDFFVDEFSGLVNGEVRVEGSIITFTPSTRLQPNTVYTVYISNAIKSSTGTSIQSVKYFSFTTQEEDILQEIPADIPRQIVLGTNVVTSVTSDFNVTDTYPAQDAFFHADRTIKIYFNDELEASNNLSRISIYTYDLLLDKAPALLAFDKYTATISAETLTIVLSGDVVLDNKIVEVRLTTMFSSTSGKRLGSTYSLKFTANLTPYFTSTKIIKLLGGSIISGVSDSSIACMIVYASAEIENKLYGKSLNERSASIIRQQYSTWMTIQNLLLNNTAAIANDYVKKTLGDFSIAVSNSAKIQFFNKLMKQATHALAKIDNMLMFAGSKGIFQKNSKNSNPDIGRLWQRKANQPGLNDRVDTGEKFMLTWNDEYTAFSPLDDSINE